MELEESTCLTSGPTTKPQSSRQYGTGTKTEIYNIVNQLYSNKEKKEEKKEAGGIGT